MTLSETVIIALIGACAAFIFTKMYHSKVIKKLEEENAELKQKIKQNGRN